MDDLDALRQRRLAELQAQQARVAQDQQAQAQKEAADDAAVDRVLMQALEPEARERLMRVRMSRPDLAAEVTAQLVAAIQQGKLARRINDADLRQILAQYTSQDRDITITRK